MTDKDPVSQTKRWGFLLFFKKKLEEEMSNIGPTVAITLFCYA